MFSFFKKKEVEEEKVDVKRIQDFNDIESVAEYFQKETGVTFEKQMSILKNKVSTFCLQRDIYSFKKLLETVQHDTNIKQEFINYLTTNETYFYREFKQIEELVSLVSHSSKNVKILCAPAATGEEPYSIAIALLEAGVSANRLSITGIDINSNAIEKAEEAIYKERNLRNLTPQIVAKYFYKDKDKFILHNEIKSLITFKLVNIFDDSFSSLGKFDYIFSRNMLIYFNNETRQRAKKILEGMCIDDTQKIFFGHADLF